MSHRERLREYNKYLSNVLRILEATDGFVYTTLEQLAANKRINSARYERELKDAASDIKYIFSNLTDFDNFMVEREGQITSISHENTGKENFQRWLGYKGKWKKEKAPKAKMPRKKRTWNLPEFYYPYTNVYLSVTAVTHRYSAARVTKNLTPIEKSAVMAGALLIYNTGIEIKGTPYRKVVRYAGAFVPRQLTEEERKRVDAGSFIVPR